MSRLSTNLSREHRIFLVVEELFGSSVVNFLLNGAIAWLMFRRARSVPLWGWTSIAADTMVTAFVLPLLTSLIVTRLVRTRILWGKLSRIPTGEIGLSGWLRWSSLQRGAILGGVAVVLVGMPAVVVFRLIGPAQLSVSSFVWLKATFASGLGAFVTPLVGWWALLEASRD